MIAHLTFGFWTLGVPAAALDLDPAIDIYTHAENHLQTGLGPVKLRARLNEMLALRNRIAHHEPIVLHVNTTVTKAGATQPPLAILRNAANGLDTFEQRPLRVADLAAALAPAAKTDIAAVPIAIRTMLDPIRDAIATSRIALEEQRDAERRSRSHCAFGAANACSGRRTFGNARVRASPMEFAYTVQPGRKHDLPGPPP
jgi:hypothetical protein